MPKGYEDDAFGVILYRTIPSVLHQQKRERLPPLSLLLVPVAGLDMHFCHR